MVLCAIGMGTYGKVQEHMEIQAEQEEVTRLISDENARRLEFEAQKEYFNSDSYIEQVAREQLGMVKANEILYVNRAQ